MVLFDLESFHGSFTILALKKISPKKWRKITLPRVGKNRKIKKKKIHGFVFALHKFPPTSLINASGQLPAKFQGSQGIGRCEVWLKKISVISALKHPPPLLISAS